jgi:hypothetical protein
VENVGPLIAAGDDVKEGAENGEAELASLAGVSTVVQK